MKIYSTRINVNKLPNYDLLLCVLKSLNPKIDEKEIVKEIKKLNLYELQESTSKGAKGKKSTITNDR